MCDVVFMRFSEEVIGYCMSNEAAEIQHGDIDFVGEFLIGDGAGYGDCSGDVEFVKELEG